MLQTEFLITCSLQQLADLAKCQPWIYIDHRYICIYIDHRYINYKLYGLLLCFSLERHAFYYIYIYIKQISFYIHCLILLEFKVKFNGYEAMKSNLNIENFKTASGLEIYIAVEEKINGVGSTKYSLLHFSPFQIQCSTSSHLAILQSLFIFSSSI